MTDASDQIDALRAALAAAEARAAAEAAEAARERAVLANAEAMIAAQKLEIEKLRRALYARRKFFELADIAASARRGKDAPPISPLALEAVKRIDAVFDRERLMNGADAGTRLAVRQAEVAPLVADLERWTRAERQRLSRHAPVAKAMNYMLNRWPSFTRFLEDGRICLTNNAAERALRAAALGRKAWLFAGSDRGGDRAAFMYTLINTAKLNGVDPQAWLADVLARIADMPLSRLPELLPWNWERPPTAVKAA